MSEGRGGGSAGVGRGGSGGGADRVPPSFTIESTGNPRVKDAAGLRDRRERERSGRTIVDGAREVGRALGAGIDVEALFVCPELARGSDADEVLAAAARQGVRPTVVSRAVAEKLAFGDRAEGLLAVVRSPAATLETLAAHLPSEPLLVVADTLEKPGNLGAICRSADGAGADGLIVTGRGGTDLYNPNAIRASLGTIFGLAPVAATAPETIAFLRARRVRLIAARVDGAPYDRVDLTGPLAIVVGSEAEGLGPEWRADDIEPVRLPMLGVADSLNVSVAAAVLLYEARRQRGLPAG